METSKGILRLNENRDHRKPDSVCPHTEIIPKIVPVGRVRYRRFFFLNAFHCLRFSRLEVPTVVESDKPRFRPRG